MSTSFLSDFAAKIPARWKRTGPVCVHVICVSNAHMRELYLLQIDVQMYGSVKYPSEAHPQYSNVPSLESLVAESSLCSPGPRRLHNGLLSAKKCAGRPHRPYIYITCRTRVAGVVFPYFMVKKPQM